MTDANKKCSSFLIYANFVKSDVYGMLLSKIIFFSFIFKFELLKM